MIKSMLFAFTNTGLTCLRSSEDYSKSEEMKTENELSTPNVIKYLIWCKKLLLLSTYKLIRNTLCKQQSGGKKQNNMLRPTVMEQLLNKTLNESLRTQEFIFS